MILNRSIKLNLLSVFGLICSAGLAQVEPGAGQWKTWVLPSSSSLPVPAPPDGNTELDTLRGIMAQRDATGSAQIAYWDAGSPGYRWMQLTTQELLTRNTPAPLATRALALVAAAIYDSTVVAWEAKYIYNRPRPSDTDPSIQPSIANPRTPSYPSEYAAAASSAAAVLAYLFPDEADNFNSMAQQAANSRLLPGTEFPSDSAAGNSIGQATGAAVVQYAKADGSSAVFTGSFPAAPGKWSNANPVQPLAGTWQPWVLTSGSQVRPPAPPAFDSPFMADQLALVKNLVRTPAVSFTAWFWQPSFFGPWVDTVSRKIFEYRLDTNAPRAARVYALTMFAQHDATLACWDTKYTYLEMRPFMFDSTVTTLFPNPGHPGFPSGHACASGGSAAVMGYLFPADAQSFTALAAQAGESTFDAGIHFQNDVDAGLALGQSVGQLVVGAASADGSQ